MRAINGAQLQRFKGRGVCHKARAAGRPVWPARGKVVFHHPFQIGLGHHRPRVMHAQHLRHIAPIVVRCARHDAVHHRTGKGAMRCDPLRQCRIDFLREGDHHAAQQMAIAGQVIQRHQRDAVAPRRVTLLQPPHDEPDSAARRARVRQIMLDIGVVQVQQATGRIMAIAFLGDGDADNPRVRVSNARQHGRRVFRRDQHFAQASNHRQMLLRPPVCASAAQRQRVQTVLRRQGIARIGMAQRYAADAPTKLRTGKRRGGVNDGFINGRLIDRSQMRAHKRAQPQMHDADTQRAPVVRRARHAGRQQTQTRGRQTRRAVRYQFHSVPSCCKRFTGRYARLYGYLAANASSISTPCPGTSPGYSMP